MLTNVYLGSNVSLFSNSLLWTYYGPSKGHTSEELSNDPWAFAIYGLIGDKDKQMFNYSIQQGHAEKVEMLMEAVLTSLRLLS